MVIKGRFWVGEEEDGGGNINEPKLIAKTLPMEIFAWSMGVALFPWLSPCIKRKPTYSMFVFIF